MKGTAALTLEERKQRRQFHLEARQARLTSTSSSSSLMTAHADMGGQLAATLKQGKEKSVDHDVAMDEQQQEQMQQSAKQMQELLHENNKEWQSSEFYWNQLKVAEEMEAAQQMYYAVLNAPHGHHRGFQEEPGVWLVAPVMLAWTSTKPSRTGMLPSMAVDVGSVSDPGSGCTRVAE